MSTQLSIFEEAGVEVTQPEPSTAVRLGTRERHVNLAKKRREALKELMNVLAELEGKDVHIGAYGGHGSYYWVNDLKLGRMTVEQPMFGDREVPSVIVLRGTRGCSVSIFTDRAYALRRQEYFGYTLWLLDFWNGFGEYPIDPYRPPGYQSLHIKRFND
ncbi:MAG: hypothetical protein ACLFVA_06575 [Dehalococcoidia bacterium]